MALVSDQEWADYKQKFEKSYEDADEEKMRRELYVKAKATVEEHNKKYEAGEVSWKMAINHLSDLTAEEFSMRCGKRVNPPPTAV